jgi:hypothetical protein
MVRSWLTAKMPNAANIATTITKPATILLPMVRFFMLFFQ